MTRTSKLETELKVGVFVTIGVLLLMAGIVMLGGTDSLFKTYGEYNVYLRDASGLLPGAKVKLNGIDVGTVSSVKLDRARKEVQAKISVDQDYADWIREDSSAEMQTQGVLGDKFIGIETLNLDSQVLALGGEIRLKASKDFKTFMSDGEKLMDSLNSLAFNLDEIMKSFRQDGRDDKFFAGLSSGAQSFSSVSKKMDKQLTALKFNSAVSKLDGILDKVNSGKGTLGALVNDPALYDDLKALFGGANRNRIMRNLIRKTIQESDENQSNLNREPTQNK